MNRTGHPSERGQELVEFVFTSIFLLAILMVILDMGRIVYYYSALQNATREGARYAIVHLETGQWSAVPGIVKNRAIGLNPADITVDPLSDPNEDTATVQVCARYHFTGITPIIQTFFGSSALNIRSCSRMRLEH